MNASEVSRVIWGLTELVRETAWFLYLERMRKNEQGTAEGDWFRAEELVKPPRQCVKVAAYFIWLERLRNGRRRGDHQSDWLEAMATQAIIQRRVANVS